MTSGPCQLVADIGATHARFALARDGRLTGERTVLATADHAQASDLLRVALEKLSAEQVSGGCFAVAGPVSDGWVEVTNGGLRFEEAPLSEALEAPVRLVNDFYALAMAVPELAQLATIGGDPARGSTRQVKAVLGPGSGLGMSMLVPVGTDGWQVLSSEGGHADLAPGNPLEQELLNILHTRHDGVCWETVLSGPGLVNLYEAVAVMWGMPAEPRAPEEISRLGESAEDPLCHQTLELFFALLGSAAGNLALTVCAHGGVYVGGGIVPGLAEFARTSPLRRRFEERVELTALVADIPIYLILDEDPGLIGAAACGAEVE
ncbi:MAG: glucokinase [Gammaproteobacteria bacterium]|nr:MAG: glucokinase [Gammaproteobacteria bacterium]